MEIVKIPFMDRYKNRKYSIGSYDPAWPKMFQMQAEQIKTIFKNDAIAIEHIGSTAVPGMGGKPAIDILILVDDLKNVKNHIPDMQSAGYEFLGEYVTQNSLLFRVMKNGHLHANLHVFPKDHPHVREMIAVRGYLRANPEEIKKYTELKEDLNREYPDSYAGYRVHKDEYMKELMERALKI